MKLIQHSTRIREYCSKLFACIVLSISFTVAITLLTAFMIYGKKDIELALYFETAAKIGVSFVDSSHWLMPTMFTGMLACYIGIATISMTSNISRSVLDSRNNIMHIALWLMFFSNTAFLFISIYALEDKEIFLKLAPIFFINLLIFKLGMKIGDFYLINSKKIIALAKIKIARASLTYNTIGKSFYTTQYSPIKIILGCIIYIITICMASALITGVINTFHANYLSEVKILNSIVSAMMISLGSLLMICAITFTKDTPPATRIYKKTQRIHLKLHLYVIIIMLLPHMVIIFATFLIADISNAIQLRSIVLMFFEFVFLIPRWNEKTMPGSKHKIAKIMLRSTITHLILWSAHVKSDEAKNLIKKHGSL